MEIETLLITQARTGSTRLPGKVMMEIDKAPLLKIHLDRISKTRKINKIIVATTDNPEDDHLANCVIEWGYSVFRGSEKDVLERYYKASQKFNPKYIIRVTSDCPLIDPDLIDQVVDFFILSGNDYCSNTIIENYPDGQDIEIFKFSALEYSWLNAKKSSEREHVTPFIRQNSNIYGNKKFSVINFPCDNNYSSIRMTVDESNDFELIKVLIQKLGINKTWREYADFIINENLLNINGNILRNEGYIKSLKND